MRRAAFAVIGSLLGWTSPSDALEAPRPWSRNPPGLAPVDVPQFVAITFDDNFVSGLGDVSGGMTWATTFFEPLQNPAGSGVAPTFDGTQARTTFYGNCLYLQDELTRKSWATARQSGHELANHTVNHPNGGEFSQQSWLDEIVPCTEALKNPENGLGLTEVRGFRAPFLAHSGALFGALVTAGLRYDSSIQSCWGTSDDGKSCAWPYTLDQGSPDAQDLLTRFGRPQVPPTAGVWEMTPSALFVPPDELASQYGFEPGLRQRVPTDLPPPSFYDAASGRVAPLDVTLFVDAGLSAAEVRAILKYSLDLRLGGNRAPFIFIAHSHVYASNYGAAPKAPSASERQGALEDFARYALSKSVVRMRPVADILSWVQQPRPLGGVVTVPLGGGGAGGAGGDGGVTTGGGGGDRGGAGSFPSGNAGMPIGGSKVASAPDSSVSETSRCAYNPSGGSSWPSALLALLFVLRIRRKVQHPPG